MAQEEDAKPAEAGSWSSERREALIKLGKYVAYATPVVVSSVSAYSASPLSGAAPSPAPTPAPSPPPSPAPSPSPAPPP